MKCLYPLLALLCALNLSLQGKEIYVSSEGNNANAGTLASPLKTIQAGINAAAAGDTVFVRALTSSNAQAVYPERLSISKSGTSAARIIVQNYPADLSADGTAAYPAVEQTGVTPPAGTTALLMLTNASYVTVAGLEFRNYETADEARTPAGIYMSGKGTGVQLLRNKVHHIYQSNTVLYNGDANGFGIAVYGSNSTTAIDQLVLDGNEVYDLRTGESESVTLNGNVTNFKVTNNSVHDGNNIGIDCIGFEQNLPDAVNYARTGLIRGNLVYNIDSQFNPGYGGNFAGSFKNAASRNDTRAAPGIYVDGGANITVERNHVHDCNMALSFASEHAGYNTVSCLARDNLFRLNHVGGIFIGGAESSNGGAKNCWITNNTLYKNDTAGAGGGSISIQHYVTGAAIRQNIMVCSSSPSVQFILSTATDSTFSAGAIDYNLYSGTGASNLEFIWEGNSSYSYSDWLADAGEDVHSLFVSSSAALFASAAPVTDIDFSLGVLSSGLNAGNPTFAAASGETDYFGLPRVSSGRVDIGMSEGGIYPHIRVDHPSGAALTSGAGSVSFGTPTVPGSDVETFVISNTGGSPLTGLTVSVSGANAAEFVPGALSVSPPLATSATSTLPVTFTPTVDGTRTATLTIASNDPSKPLFTIALTGVGRVPVAFTTQPLPKTVNPGAAASFTCVVNTGATKPVTYQWQKYNTLTSNWDNIALATSATYTIAKAVESNQGDYRCAATNPVNTAFSDSATLIVNDPVSITAQPASATVATNSSTTFTVVATGGDPKNYVWRKNSVAIVGAPNAPSFTVSNVQIASAGSYSVVVTNGVNSLLSASAVLTVVDTTPKTLVMPSLGKAVFTASYGGTPSSFVWKKHNGTLPAGDFRFTFVKNIMAITSLQTTDADYYTCDITGPDGGTVSATTTLIVYGSPPEITGTEPLSMGTAMVGDPTYSFQIPYNPDPLKTPTSFSAAPLPAGLKCNAVTGVISGKPTVAIAADTTYPITLAAANAKNKSVKKASLLIKALPTAAIGTFTGPIARDASINKNLGGRFDLTATAAGSFTAKVTLGILAYSTTGSFTSDVTATNAPAATFVIKRAPTLPDLTVSFKVDSANQVLTACSITDSNNAHASFSAWRKRWGTVMTTAESDDLKTYLGYYTFGIDPPIPSVTPPVTPAEVLPQGLGYGYFTVATTGLLTVVARVPDGTVISTATYSGPHGEVMVYCPLYSNLGSALGTLDITQGTKAYVPAYGDNSLGGTITLLRPQILGTNHVYNAGFGPMSCTVAGGRYTAPVAPALLLGVTDDGVTPNTNILFTDGGISGTSTDATGTVTSPNVSVRLRAKGVVYVPPHSLTVIPDPNPRSTTLAIAQGTGLFSGKFTLVDTNPAVNGSNVTRTVGYSGVLFRNGGVVRGGGYFLLPRRPTLPTQTVLTTDQLSGQVIIEKR